MEVGNTIAVGSEGEETSVRPQRGRKPNAWTRRNEEDQASLDTTSLSPRNELEALREARSPMAHGRGRGGKRDRMKRRRYKYYKNK